MHLYLYKRIENKYFISWPDCYNFVLIREKRLILWEKWKKKLCWNARRIKSKNSKAIHGKSINLLPTNILCFCWCTYTLYTAYTVRLFLRLHKVQWVQCCWFSVTTVCLFCALLLLISPHSIDALVIFPRIHTKTCFSSFAVFDFRTIFRCEQYETRYSMYNVHVDIL